MKKTGIMICGHGSRSKPAGEEFGLLAAGLKQRYPEIPIEYGFLEYSAPNIHMGLDRLREQGVEEIYAVPGMLFAATHVKNDIPSVLTTYQEKHSELTLHYGRELGLHSNMIMAFETRILEALGMKEAPHHGELYDTMLVVVGRGTSDTWANAEVAKLSRIVAEDLGFGWTETVYSGVTFPSVGQGLEMALKLGYKRVVVAPYFLFTGRLINRIYDYVDVVAEQHLDVELIKANYLKDQSHVLETFMARVRECQSSETDDVDLMQSFKERLDRGEVEIHHHHAEYQPDENEHQHDHTHEHSHSHSHNHDHSHDHSHDHGHHHGYYKHVAHPHGPRTMIDENICHCFMRQIPDEIIEEERKLRKQRNAVTYREKAPH